MMLALPLTMLLLVTVTVAIHALGTIAWIRYLSRDIKEPGGDFKPHQAMPALIWTAPVLLMLHMVEVIVWALAYLLIMPGETISTFETAVYFSVVTFTTLGYGDITLVSHDWRLLSGVQALNGILLVGWSTALTYAVFQRSWKGLVHSEAQ